MKHYHSTPPYDEVTRADLDRDAREYADTTKRLADRTPPKPDRPTTRPNGPQWGDGTPIPDDTALYATESEYMAAVDQHRRNQ